MCWFPTLSPTLPTVTSFSKEQREGRCALSASQSLFQRILPSSCLFPNLWISYHPTTYSTLSGCPHSWKIVSLNSLCHSSIITLIALSCFIYYTICCCSKLMNSWSLLPWFYHILCIRLPGNYTKIMTLIITEILALAPVEAVDKKCWLPFQ